MSREYQEDVVSAHSNANGVEASFNTIEAEEVTSSLVPKRLEKDPTNFPWIPHRDVSVDKVMEMSEEQRADLGLPSSDEAVLIALEADPSMRNFTIVDGNRLRKGLNSEITGSNGEVFIYNHWYAKMVGNEVAKTINENTPRSALSDLTTHLKKQIGLGTVAMFEFLREHDYAEEISGFVEKRQLIETQAIVANLILARNADSNHRPSREELVNRTRGMSVASRFIYHRRKQQDGNTFTNDFWDCVDEMVAKSPTLTLEAKASRSGVMQQVYGMELLHTAGVGFQLATPEQDAFEGVDMWIVDSDTKENLFPVDVKGTSSGQHEVFLVEKVGSSFVITRTPINIDSTSNFIDAKNLFAYHGIDGNKLVEGVPLLSIRTNKPAPDLAGNVTALIDYANKNRLHAQVASTS